MEFSLQRIATYLVLVGLVVALGQWHKRRTQYGDSSDNAIYRKIIDRHLLQDTTDLGGKTPVWVPVVHENNARHWPSYGSRMTRDINKPYLTLCIETIVKNAGEDYSVVVLDDTSYGRLIPGWDIDLSTIAEPMRGYLRTLAQWKILYYYGGVLCPPTTICLKSFDVLTDVASDRCFSVEVPSTALSDNLYQASTGFMGSPIDDACMQKLIESLEKVVSYDSTEAVVFNGDVQHIVAQAAQRGELTVIDGSLVGVKSVSGCPVTVDNLFEGVEMPDDLWGVVLPEAAISARQQYGWFQRMSSKQIMESSVPFSVYYRWALQR